VRASCIHAPFTILVYGSASYGFNDKQYGNLDDIDLFLIFPRKFPARDILKISEEIFQTDFDISPKHLQECLRGSWEMCRMYGHTQGIRLGFRLLCQDTFNFLCSNKGSVADIRNVAKIGSSRIIIDVEWSIKGWGYVPIELTHSLIWRGEESLVLVNHHVFTQRMERLGALGRKLLTCTILYDFSQKAGMSLDGIWELFITACLKIHPNLSTDDIINSVMRSEKFSLKFREYLAQKINKIRS